MALVYNPHNIDIENGDALIRKFDNSQKDFDLKREIQTTIEAENIILAFKRRVIVAYKLGAESDKFLKNRVTIYLYHVPKEELVTG